MTTQVTLRQKMAEFYRTSAMYQSQLASHEIDSASYYVDWFRGFVPTDCRVLDLGCGTGKSTLLLRRRGFDAIGVDLSDLFLGTHVHGSNATFA